MGFSEWLLLLWQIISEVTVTHFVIAWEFVRWIIPRRCKSVKGQIVLVTGAGHGLGKNIAINMGRLQATVVCLDIDADSNLRTVQEIKQNGGCAFSYTVDVSDRNQVLEISKDIEEQVGSVQILINNVGIYPVKPVLDWTHEELLELTEVNFISHFWTLQAFLPGMIARNNGHVVAISSAAAIAPVASEVPYSSSKAAVTALMDGLRQETYFNKKCEIKFTTVHPYYTATRTDLPVRFEIRFGRLSPSYVSAEIVKGILQEREMITVPRFMKFWIYFMRCLPQTAQHRWRQVFYTRVYPESNATKLQLEESDTRLEQITKNDNETDRCVVSSKVNNNAQCYVNEGNTIEELSNCNQDDVNNEKNECLEKSQDQIQILSVRL